MSVSTLVLGRPGLTRDIVEQLLADSRYAGIDLDDLEADPEHTVVAVLVDPGPEHWVEAQRIDAQIVALLEMTPDDDALVMLYCRGADAVLDTACSIEELHEAVDRVADGGAVLTPEQARAVLWRLRREVRSLSLLPKLTKRETEILQSIDQGEAVKQTARTLGISEKTVQNLQSRLFRKLQARNRAQAIARAHELGLLNEVRS